jgi:hypothetical protein
MDGGNVGICQWLRRWLVIAIAAVVAIWLDGEERKEEVLNGEEGEGNFS